MCGIIVVDVIGISGNFNLLTLWDVLYGWARQRSLHESGATVPKSRQVLISAIPTKLKPRRERMAEAYDAEPPAIRRISRCPCPGEPSDS